jgi:hypothetical protein
MRGWVVFQKKNLCLGSLLNPQPPLPLPNPTERTIGEVLSPHGAWAGGWWMVVHALVVSGAWAGGEWCVGWW